MISNLDRVLVHLEIMGIVPYLFATNVQREQIGASWLVSRLPDWFDTAVLDAGAGARVSPVSSRSGMVSAVVDSPELARGLLERVSRTALAEAPGLDVCGAWVPLGDRDLTQDDLRKGYRALERAHSGRVSMDQCSPVIPFLDVCRVSNQPVVTPLGHAAEWRRDREAGLSLPSRAKRLVAPRFRDHLLAVLAAGGVGEEDRVRLVPHLRELEVALTDEPGELGDLSWLGIVYADVNHLGSALAGLPETGQALCDRQQVLTAAIAVVIEAAYVEAAREVLRVAHTASDGPPPRVLPLFPIMLGGDDLTVVVHGNYAFAFVGAYLAALEQLSANHPDLVNLTTTGGFRAAAGVALVKPTFPYHFGVELAQELCDEAKRGGRADSRVEFEVVHDSLDIRLDQLRRRHQVPRQGPLRAAGTGLGTLPGLLTAAASVVSGKTAVPRGQLIQLMAEVQRHHRSRDEDDTDDLGPAAAARWQRLRTTWPTQTALLGGPEGEPLWSDRTIRRSTLFDVKAILDVTPPAVLRAMTGGGADHA
ncbi:hypothetical protein [Granulicoccus sp. GXG6511]|uniref:hypothetical protein n=1 Tax=Granulicoccus sp. GXG6511 TaxID=3381351 RepID=UPI003D7E2013